MIALNSLFKRKKIACKILSAPAKNQINAEKFSKRQSQAPILTIALIIIDNRSAKFICIALNHIRLRHKD